MEKWPPFWEAEGKEVGVGGGQAERGEVTTLSGHGAHFPPLAL